jgi:hypothetical protein
MMSHADGFKSAAGLSAERATDARISPTGVTSYQHQLPGLTYLFERAWQCCLNSVAKTVSTGFMSPLKYS